MSHAQTIVLIIVGLAIVQMIKAKGEAFIRSLILVDRQRRLKDLQSYAGLAMPRGLTKLRLRAEASEKEVVDHLFCGKSFWRCLISSKQWGKRLERMEQSAQRAYESFWAAMINHLHQSSANITRA
jgi:hypothetical protein